MCTRSIVYCSFIQLFSLFTKYRTQISVHQSQRTTLHLTMHPAPKHLQQSLQYDHLP